jgi:hypothetical protein
MSDITELTRIRELLERQEAHRKKRNQSLILVALILALLFGAFIVIRHFQKFETQLEDTRKERQATEAHQRAERYADSVKKAYNDKLIEDYRKHPR